VDPNTPGEQLRKEILHALKDEKIFTMVNWIDIFQVKKGDAVKRKQITFRITLHHYEKTLQPKDIQTLREKVVKKVSKKFDAKLI
jgi:phenylalanyl-tRNA synthetase beta subunit